MIRKCEDVFVILNDDDTELSCVRIFCDNIVPNDLNNKMNEFFALRWKSTYSIVVCSPYVEKKFTEIIGVKDFIKHLFYEGVETE